MTTLRGTAKSASGAAEFFFHLLSSVLQGRGIAASEDVSTTILPHPPPPPKTFPHSLCSPNPRPQCRYGSQSPWTLQRASLIYTSTNVWTAARAAKNSTVAPHSKKLLDLRGWGFSEYKLLTNYTAVLLLQCVTLTQWVFFMRYNIQLSTWIRTGLFNCKYLSICTPLQLLMLNELRQIDWDSSKVNQNNKGLF